VAFAHGPPATAQVSAEIRSLLVVVNNYCESIVFRQNVLFAQTTILAVFVAIVASAGARHGDGNIELEPLILRF
jgi:hypothetical protein